MKRKDYEKPTMQVVRLQHRGLLLTSGETDGLGGRGQYEEDDTNPFGY